MSPDSVRWLSEEQQKSWRAYIVGTTLLLETLDKELRAEHHISLDEYEILVRLSEATAHRMRMSTLADALCHSRSRITHTVARMQRERLVDRAKTPDDGRGVDVHLTAAGVRLLNKAAPLHVNGVREHFVELVSSADFAVLGRTFNKVTDQLMPGHPEAVDIR